MVAATVLFLIHTLSAAAPVQPNDNRTSAGTLVNGVLTLRLEATLGSWRPEAQYGPAFTFPVFAEQGKAPQRG